MVLYVASLADGETHSTEPAPQGFVTAQCSGRQFRPLVALNGAPSDHAQICPACRSDRSPKGTTRSE